MKVQKLPAETRSKLQSGVLITDAVQCVLELVHNSLDAEATGIAVRIDLKSYQIQVIDNGRGIAKEDLEFVGERFMTSKYESAFNLETSFPTYGFKGQALSSLLEVSRTLTIKTKSENDGPVFKKVFKNNKALPITTTDDEKQGTGTTVIVEDFMHSMPVRRKRISEVFDLEEIKNQLQYLAIIHYNVCFTLRNENKGLILLQTSKASSILESLKNIYGKSLTKSLKSVYYKENKYEIGGFISLKPQRHNNLQLLYVNKRMITKGIIHKFINNLTKEYSGKKALLSSSPIGQIMKKFKTYTHNVFIIKIHCPPSYYELFTNLRKTTVEFKNWKDVLKCIHKAVKRTFKKYIKSDSLSSSHNCNEEFEPVNDKKAFGTSLLLNAVKGAPAKRNLYVKKDIKKKKQKKPNETIKSSEASLAKIKDKPKPLVDDLNSITQRKEYTNDSLESPIPKKKYKTVCDLKINKSASINQSVVEFYEWLKAKFDSDIHAFNFYTDFLQFKNSGTNAKEVTEFNSPVLGGKPKAKKAVKRKKKNLLENELNVVDEEIASMTEKQLKIFPSVQLRLQREVQFSKLNNSISESISFDCMKDGRINIEQRSTHFMFKKPENLNVSNKTKLQVGHSPSLPSSEMQFTNIIKFRNLPESFFHQSSKAHGEIPVKKAGCSMLNTWESHYQNLVSNNIEIFEDRWKRNYFSWTETKDQEVSMRNDNLDLNFYNFLEGNLFEFNHRSKRGEKLQNVEVQVSLADIPPQKVDAMVQTSIKVPESPSFENSYVFNEPNYITSGCDVREINVSREVPNPDFWNTTAYLENEKSINANVVSGIDEEAASNIKSVVNYEKNSTSSEFICGHKSHSPTKSQNERCSSKETQTIAGIWTDSLTQVGYVTEKVNANSESGDTNSKMAKTIPIQEIESVTSQPNFCLTERHDFVPKGLSPAFLYTETSKIFNLNPLEKGKLKLTIDDTQSELLANIKWQDDSTGDYIKPTIPDRILFEMRQKAEENGANCENSILSASMTYCAVKVHNLLHSFAFTKELLSGVEILGQLDKKFIVTKIKIHAPKKMELITLFDQHAVDERIKLEQLITDNLSTDGKLISSSLNPPVECILMESDVRIVSDLQGKMSNFGLSVKPINKKTIVVSAIPTFLLNKHEKDLKNKKETNMPDCVKALIGNIIDETMDTRGAVSKMPKIIYNAFCSEACHKAIKFNKALTIENMKEMIQKLQKCKLPFQCAHGRPSVMPIIDLEDFSPLMEEKKAVDFQELQKFYNERKRFLEPDVVAN